MVVRSCLLFLAASVVSSQFLDFSSFSLFPGVSNQRVPNFSDYLQRQSSSLYYEDGRRQSTTKQPQITSTSYDSRWSTTKRPQSSYYDDSRQTLTRKQTRTTAKPLNFASFIDVPSSDNRQFFSSQRNDQSSQGRAPGNGENENPRIIFNQVTDSDRRTEERNPFDNRGTRTQVGSTNRPQEERNQYNIHDSTNRRPLEDINIYNSRDFTTRRPQEDSNSYYSRDSTSRRPQEDTNSYYSRDSTSRRPQEDTNSYYSRVSTSRRPQEDVNSYNSRDSTSRRPQEDTNSYYSRDSTRRPPQTRNPFNEYARPQVNQYEYTTRPEYYNSGDRQNDRNNYRPSIDENRDPITNKPPRIDGFVFREEDETPELITGPDEELLSDEKKRRALQIAERMCARFAAESTDSVAAIPLLPSPAPVTVAVQRCTPDTVPLVVGGQVVAIQQHPHMAAVGWPNLRGGGYSWKCGGTLVSERYVLTAAHCSYQDRDNTVVQGPPRVVQLGSARLSDPEATMARVAAVVRHPKYKTPAAYYDIALLKLAVSVRLSDRIRPACVGEPPPPGQSIIATGWGRTEFGGAMSQQLRGVSLPVWEISECARALGTSRKLPNGAEPHAQMCAGELRGGKDTCQGDSGGPAVVGSPCLWRVVGVTSLGRACGAPRTPALYARTLPAFVAAVVWL